MSQYGYCPICGAPGVGRERRMDGNDMCSNGHTYKSSLAVNDANPIKGPLPRPKNTNPVLSFIDEYLCHGGFFNPELMSPEKVRDLIMLCREEITRLEEYEWMYKDLQK